MNGAKKLFGTLAVVGGLSLAGVTCNNVTTQEATYNGVITSFGKEGLVWKTYEASVAIGGTDRSVTGYTSLDAEARSGENIEELAKKLQDAANTGKPVKMHCKHVAYSWPWRSNTHCHLQSIEYVK